MNCISCGYNKLSTFLSIQNAPRCVQVIPESALSVDKKVNIEVLKCQKCTLVQLSKNSYVYDSYYDDYLMSRTYSKFSQNYQKNLAREFIEEFSLQNKNVVDVGSGDGFFVSLLEKYGAKAIGIEPSESACRLARKRNTRVVQGYVNDEFISKDKYDAFVTCQVFEHISDPVNLLNNIKKMLNKGAVGLIEIPSLLNSLGNDRFFDFFPDHVVYYTPASLSYLLENNGFDVISVRHTANNEYITAFIRLKSRDDSKAQETFTSYRESYKSFFDKHKKSKIVIWGAGAKGISSLSFSDVPVSNILYCVDSDPNKHGKYLPGTHIKVISPDELHNAKIDLVIVTALMYRDEILTTLKEKYHLKNSQIALISPQPHLLSENNV